MKAELPFFLCFVSISSLFPLTSAVSPLHLRSSPALLFHHPTSNRTNLIDFNMDCVRAEPAGQPYMQNRKFLFDSLTEETLW